MFFSQSFHQLRFNKIDFFIIIHTLVLFVFYIQIDNIDAIKEGLTFIIGPFLLYFIGKAVSKSNLNESTIFKPLTLVLILYSCSLFFRDVGGNFSIDLDVNYYYNSRNRLIDKSSLIASFTNETNLSLIVLTSIYYVLFFFNKRIPKLVILFTLLSVLLILASRAGVVTLCIILLINYYDKIRKNKLFSFLSGAFLFITFINIISVFEIPYISTFFTRTLEKSFGTDNQFHGLEGRFLYYANAYQNSQYFNINGYKFLLNKYHFSSHNEILGHTSAVGIIPAFSYFIILFLLIKKCFINIKFTGNNIMKKIVISMLISYVIVGFTENIYIANIMWIYLFLFTLGYSSISKK